ncbi:multidrug DMT transporter permease [candidate division KSB1 bacterium]|nr:multidrug DMT transporter permease [candidate division KSB1 bacterium]
MVLIQDYTLAIIFCGLAMICWGSWPNTQKLASKAWRFQLYYWDMIIGIILMSLIAAFTVGSLGSAGQPFIRNLQQADTTSIFNAVLGGLLWNTGNLLLVAAIAVAGMSVAFPIGGGIAWILGILINYIVVLISGNTPSNKPVLLWSGVAIIIVAIFLSGKSYDQLSKKQKKPSLKGILLSVFGGLFIAFYYGVLVRSLDGVLVEGGTGHFTPYTAIVFLSLGTIIGTIPMNYYFMRKPVEGPPMTMKDYFSGHWRNHMTGVLGGMIWCLGMIFSFMAVGAASPAIAYGLSNAAPVAAFLWGVFIWKEFKGAPRGTNRILTIMFTLYLIGLFVITMSNV